MAATQSTYRAVQAVSPGKLELTNLPVVEPPAGHVEPEHGKGCVIGVF